MLGIDYKPFSIKGKYSISEDSCPICIQLGHLQGIMRGKSHFILSFLLPFPESLLLPFCFLIP